MKPRLSAETDEYWSCFISSAWRFFDWGVAAHRSRTFQCVILARQPAGEAERAVEDPCRQCVCEPVRFGRNSPDSPVGSSNTKKSGSPLRERRFRVLVGS